MKSWEPLDSSQVEQKLGVNLVKGNKGLPPQNMPLWDSDYFNLILWGGKTTNSERTFGLPPHYLKKLRGPAPIPPISTDKLLLSVMMGGIITDSSSLI